MTVSLRKFPFPYKSMVGVHSDIDSTNYVEAEELLTFLNTEEETSLGKGVGLTMPTSVIGVEGSSTLGIFNHKPGAVATEIDYVPWRVRPDEDWARETLLEYIDKGWIEFLHSFSGSNNSVYEAAGFQVFNRQWVEKYLDWVNTYGRKLEYYIGHSQSSSNITSLNDHNSTPGNPMYWTDLGIEAGIRFFETRQSGSGRQYETPNTGHLVFPVTFADGNKAWSFVRTYGAGNGRGAPAANNIHYWAHKEKLDEYVQKGVLDIIAIHWGYHYTRETGFVNDPEPKIPQTSVDSLHLLKEYNDDGRILITSTGDILQYDLAQQVTEWTVSKTEDNGQKITITNFNDTQFGAHLPDVEEIRGLTFYVDNSELAEIWIGSAKVDEKYIVRNGQDHTGRESIGIEWNNFEFPKNYVPEDPNLEHVDVLNIMTSEGITKLPLYETDDSSDSSKLKINTQNGVREFELVDLSDEKASNVRVSTKSGIKSVSQLRT